ncbi:hypothetical protein [Mesorhizobium sp. M0013]|uniref:hypothetical protein n=1 Tax=Mesorhizobium sp. M0013 TaxID=2956841 RepID=UPI00333DD965
MASPKRLTNLTDYAAILPYASELFGIYQPLLGWKSKRAEARFRAGYEVDRAGLIRRLRTRFGSDVVSSYSDDGSSKIALNRGAIRGGEIRAFDSLVLDAIAQQLPPLAQLTGATWTPLLSAKAIDSVLTKVVTPAYMKSFKEDLKSISEVGRPPYLPRGTSPEALRNAYDLQLRHESQLAGALQHIAQQKQIEVLREIFYRRDDGSDDFEAIDRALGAAGAPSGYLDLSNLNPRDRDQLERVALSPISVVHLFRQYFFELDSFLGPPVGHVWLSPGSTVELVEVQTRRTVVERLLEQATDTVQRQETETVEEEELSDAVRQENQRDTKFGASLSLQYAALLANTSYDLNTSQQLSREETHRRMRSQTEKLSSEIRRSFKSTFRTITETTDTSSKRYVLANTTSELVNYEMRRKMRQVAVQVQDIGSYLCWQTYVDWPGEELGIAKLVHIGQPPELDGLQAPEEVPLLQPFTDNKTVTIPFVPIGLADNKGELYVDGVESDNTEGWWFLPGNLERIQADFDVHAICPRSGYELTGVEFDSLGKPVTFSLTGQIANNGARADFILHLETADFQGQPSIDVGLILHWSPTAAANNAITTQNQTNVDAFKASEQAEFQKAFVETAKERVKIVHEIRRRPGSELREEERIVVYRQLIQELLTAGVPMPDDRSRHIVAELLNSIFDVEKMLYFVAPEWWRPRRRRYAQEVGEGPRGGGNAAADIADTLKRGLARASLTVAKGAAPKGSLGANAVGWGGVEESNRDSYYITSDSEPARFGSSLGWLLQLDGDNMRNAFLNAPWVKAVIPIRPGKEIAAINWLKGVEGFNGITATDVYQTSNANELDINGNPLNGQTVLNVIEDLARKIQRKHAEGIQRGTFPQASEVADPQLVDAGSVVTSTPIDRVYEHGFFPLEGGFRANVTANYEVFDQWLEVLPTDQVVPVPVSYDPKTGRQL